MNLCTVCGKKVPKKRSVSGPSEYSGFFCSNACHWSHNDQMMKMMRETELEVEDELQRETGTSGRESWTAEALDALDQAAATATAGSQTPEEIAAKFLGAFAGKFGVKFATRLYGNFAETAKAWAKARAEKKAAEEEVRRTTEETARQKAQANPPPPQPGPTPPPRQDPGSSHHAGKPDTPGANGRQKPGSPRREPPGWKTIPEPKDLDDLPLDEQREWLLRRFYLPATATMDDVRAKYKVLARKYHPDNRVTGKVRVMATINATKQRLEEIERELQPAGGKKKRR